MLLRIFFEPVPPYAFTAISVPKDKSLIYSGLLPFFLQIATNFDHILCFAKNCEILDIRKVS